MQLPSWLRDAIEDIAAEVPQRDLARAAAELSDAYRTGDFSRAPLDSNARRIAYLAQRLPATYAACTRVFEEIRTLAPDFHPRTLLDLGAGPGTASMAGAGVWPEIELAIRVDRDAFLMQAGERLASSHPHPAVAAVSWVKDNLPEFLRTFPLEDGVNPESAADARSSNGCELIVLSYALGEFSDQERTRIATDAWRVCRCLLVLIEPGTQRGFSNVFAARDLLTGLGAHILAPCPRSGPHRCPMAEANDWCHFSQRVERTSLHRQLKAGELGYEDEKFSYVVLCRQPLPTAQSRIVRHPAIRKGHVELQLCTPSGIQRVTVGKNQKERYRAARRVSWGDSFQI